MEEFTARFLVDGQSRALTGAHASYIQAIDGNDFSGDKLVALVRALPPNATILDIGANIGLTTLIMSAIRPNDRIFAYEPVPQNAAFLRRNLAQNSIENVSVIETAVGDFPGQAVLSNDGPWSLVRPVPAGDASMKTPVTTLDEFYDAHLQVRRAGKADVKPLNIPVTMLDDCLESQLHGRRIDLIKIDVEGYEPNVLAGARQLIETFRSVIYLEFNAWTLLLQSYNPLAFATSLMAAFDVEGKDGQTWLNPISFLYNNITTGFVSDLVLRLRPRAAIPHALQMKYGTDQESQSLRAEIAAIRASTSWRLTTPLRAMKNVLWRK